MTGLADISINAILNTREQRKKWLKNYSTGFLELT